LENSIKNIYEGLNNTINSFSFMDKYRLSKTAFTRNRTLNFPTLILYFLNLRKHSNQVELDQFFKGVNNEKVVQFFIIIPLTFWWAEKIAPPT